MHIELRHLRYFITVAEELNFSRAAERLFMAQPPLSQQIRHLEQEMGVILLERTSRRVQLTQAGESFLAEARATLARFDEAIAAAQKVGRGETGWLSVGFVGSATYTIMPTVLREFRHCHPQVELLLHEMTTSEQAQALREKRLHVGFVRPFSEAGITQEPILSEPIIVALPIDHPLAKQEAVALSSLATEPLIVCPRFPKPCCTDYLLALCEAAGLTPHIAQVVRETQTAIAMVGSGAGVALVPASMQNLRRPDVAYRPLVEPAPRLQLMVAYRDEETAPLLKAFLTTVRERIAPACEKFAA